MQCFNPCRAVNSSDVAWRQFPNSLAEEVGALQVNSSSYVDPLAQSGRGGGEDGMVLALFSDRTLLQLCGIFAMYLAINRAGGDTRRLRPISRS